MSFTKKYKELEDNEQVNRWYLNNRARSPISADIWRRNLGLYCRVNEITPDGILKQARDGSLKGNFQDFAMKMISEGRRGAYVGKFKQVIRSWLMFNDVDYRIKINIPNESVNETTMDERVPTKEELSKIFRKASTRGRLSMSLLALSGLRPESLGNYEGTDGLVIGDIEDLDIDKLTFTRIPAKVNVRNNLSKARFRYFSFLSEEGCMYMLDYLSERINAGEKLDAKSPLLITDPTNASTRREFLRTMLVTREIRETIRSVGLRMRPYVLRAYFATALDIAESKGLISHPWRQFIMGH
ncbi:MAG: site-specific integrase [Thermoplasmataceae archaeon]